jgi:uncharacterized protein (DUF1330 family)
MPAYVGFLVDIHDSATFSAYARAVAPTYGTYGGKVALRGPITEVVEGTLDIQDDTRVVIIEFSSIDSAVACGTPLIIGLVTLRRPPVADGRVFFVDGFNIATA